ncbi:MAG: DUF3696 domain-containing protein [Caldilineaceae bacterium]
MLTELTLRNIKCFQQETKVPFRQINLLTGINGRGKSTVLQALLLMRQSPEHNQTTDQIIFNGSCIHLGNFDDARNSATPKSEPIELTFGFASGADTLSLKYILVENEHDEMMAQVAKINVLGQVEQVAIQAEAIIRNDRDNYSLHFMNLGLVYQVTLKDLLFDLFYGELDKQADEPTQMFCFIDANVNFCRIHYISADRIGPQDFYPKQSFAEFANVGARGEFTANVLSKKKNELVNPALCLETGETHIVLDQTEAWLDAIFGGGKLAIEELHANIVLMTLNAESTTNFYRPVNVGFGYSYALPIIVSGLIAQPGEMLIVENPEAHLHPSAQSKLTKFLAKVSATGVQVFIESHSDHVLNALRIAVLDNIVHHSDLSVLYFTRSHDQSVEQIAVKADGAIEYWPTGFFDQTDEDYERLFGL